MKQRLSYNNTILANSCETLAYIKAGLAGDCWEKCRNPAGCCCIPQEGDNLTGDITGAEWYDPDNPCSEQYLGFLITEIKYGTAYKRKVKDTVGGGFTGSRGLTAREITVRGWIVSSSECGTEFGIDYLNTTLDYRNCIEDYCAKPELEVYSCCDLEDPEKGKRILKGVAPLSSVRELTPDSEFRCCRTQVEFKLAADVPYFFRDKQDIVVNQPFTDFQVCPNWCCPECDSGIVWPDCVIGEQNTGEYLFSQAGADALKQNCFCEPVFAFFDCVPVPAAGMFPKFLSWTLRSTEDVSNVVVAYYESPDGAAGSPVDDPAAYVCVQPKRTNISYLPAGHDLSLDSGSGGLEMTDTVTGERVASFGIGGAQSIQLGCNPGYLCVYADHCNGTAVTGLLTDVCCQIGTL